MPPIRTTPLLRGASPSPLSLPATPKASSSRSIVDHASILSPIRETVRDEFSGNSGQASYHAQANLDSASISQPSFRPSGPVYLPQGAQSNSDSNHGIFGPGSRAILSGPTYFQTHIHQERRMEGIQILYMNSAPAAAYNSRDRYDPPKCHPNTRTGLLTMTQNWADTGVPRIMWLYGTAGAGKSAVAQTTCERLKEKSNLAGSFFFSRTAATDSHRGHEGRFVATLCYQLTEVIPDLRAYVDQVILNRPSVFDLTLNEQVLALIINPLAQLKWDNIHHDRPGSVGTHPRVIIVDGLDECKEESGQEQVLDAIATLVGHQDTFPFSVFIASRPEVVIRTWFATTNSNSPQLAQSVSLREECDSDKDIETFVNDEAAEIRQSHPFKYRIPADWPKPKVVKELVERASGQFVFASTVMKYAKDPRGDPTRRLEYILEYAIPEHDRPYATLDALYLHILRKTQHPKHVHRLLAFRVVSINFYCEYRLDEDDDDNDNTMGYAYNAQINASLIERFLDLPCSADALLIDLQSIINYSIFGLSFQCVCRDSDEVTSGESSLGVPIPSLFYHASLLDFLLDPQRSEEFYVDTVRFDKIFTEMALQQVKNTGPDLSEEGFAIYCFVILIQTCQSGHSPYIDEIHAELSRWGTLDDEMLYDIVFSVQQNSEVDFNLWKVFAPAVARKRRQCQEKLERAGLPRELFALFTEFAPQLPFSIPCATHPDMWIMPQRILMLDMVQAASEIQERTGVERQTLFCGNYFYSLLFRNYDYDLYLSNIQTQGDELEPFGHLHLDHSSSAAFLIRHIISLLDPSKEAAKSMEIQAYFDLCRKELGDDWRLQLMREYLDSYIIPQMWFCAPSLDIISALDEIIEFFIAPCDLDSVQGQSWSTITNEEKLVYYLDSGFHWYIHICHLWNKGRHNSNVRDGARVDIMQDGAWLDKECYEHIYTLSALRYSRVKDTITGLPRPLIHLEGDKLPCSCTKGKDFRSLRDSQ